MRFMDHKGEQADRVRGHEWSATPLGAQDFWPSELRTLVSLMLTANQPMFIVWGNAQTLLYNDHLRPILGDKHPEAFGRPFLKVWSDVAETMRPIVEAAYAGTVTHMDDITLFTDRYGYEEETHFSFSFNPISNDDGEVLGFFCPCIETTQAVIAARSIRENNVRNRQIVDSAIDYAIIATDLTGHVTTWNEGARRILGWTEAEMLGEPLERIFTPEDRELGRLEREMEDALEQGRGNDERWHVRKDGERFWAAGEMTPLLNEEQTAVGFVKVLRDQSVQRLAEEERDRFVRLAENSTDFVGMADTQGRVFYINDAARRLVGLEDEDITKLVISDFFPPEEVETVAQTVLPTVVRDGHWAGELSFRHFSTGELIPVLYSVFPITDAAGALIGYGTVTRDYRELKRAESDMQLLNGELAHRLKNVLAVVQSISQQTLRTAPDMTSASRDLGARLAALGAATDVLTGSSWRSADLGEVARRALAPHGTIGERILLAGPRVNLKAEVTVAFALALHELATNAAKYGALSNDRGTVTFEWNVAGEGDDATLSICWREQGGPPVYPPQREGFGSVLIERSLKSYFRGQVATHYKPEGLSFELEARLSDATKTGE